MKDTLQINQTIYKTFPRAKEPRLLNTSLFWGKRIGSGLSCNCSKTKQWLVWNRYSLKLGALGEAAEAAFVLRDIEALSRWVAGKFMIINHIFVYLRC